MLSGEQTLKQMHDNRAKESLQCSFVWVPITTVVQPSKLNFLFGGQLATNSLGLVAKEFF